MKGWRALARVPLTTSKAKRTRKARTLRQSILADVDLIARIQVLLACGAEDARAASRAVVSAGLVQVMLHTDGRVTLRNFGVVKHRRDESAANYKKRGKVLWEIDQRSCIARTVSRLLHLPDDSATLDAMRGMLFRAARPPITDAVENLRTQYERAVAKIRPRTSLAKLLKWLTAVYQEASPAPLPFIYVEEKRGAARMTVALEHDCLIRSRWVRLPSRGK